MKYAIQLLAGYDCNIMIPCLKSKATAVCWTLEIFTKVANSPSVHWTETEVKATYDVDDTDDAADDDGGIHHHQTYAWEDAEFHQVIIILNFINSSILIQIYNEQWWAFYKSVKLFFFHFILSSAWGSATQRKVSQDSSQQSA